MPGDFDTPNRFRRAWCELTGGHDDVPRGIYMGWKNPVIPIGIPARILLMCTRCGRATRCHALPEWHREKAKTDGT